ncbi:transcriptional regulator, MucR family [Arboricoccus pini]|uniref:Transcriptional regulator, MucR family n=1 Tax=Arboricoccus pini TaxID=1963835 RepID=A0A212RR66_9PROT|nr:MucR family transcriptional regulator [Arboricoccus pini]SNB74970.1 transcriptional regulator, MucR family [Arboricoccus pini]
MSQPIEERELIALTSEIVAAYVSNNQVATSDLPILISSVFKSMANVGQSTEAPAPEKLNPAVPVKKSVHPDYIVCLEDGKKLKMLKRHLRTRYNMTPADYRRKWGLPEDYPMVAPNYTEQRSGLAKKIGLGQKRPVEPAAEIVANTVRPGRRVAGRKKVG